VSGNELEKDARTRADNLYQEMVNGDLDVLRRIIEEHPTTMHIEECAVCRASSRVPFGIMICGLPIVDAELQRRTLLEADLIEYAGPLNDAVRFIVQNDATTAEILDLIWAEFEYEIDAYLAEDIALHKNISVATLNDIKQRFELDV
jgi:hypothetical protein